MQMLNLRTFTRTLPFGVALSLCVACGGNDDGGGKNANGGTSSTTGGSSSAGSDAKAGSSNNGGGNSGGGGSSVSLPDDKPLGTLSDSEVQQLCEDYEAFTSSSGFAMSQQEFSCLLAGVFGALFSGAMTDAELQTVCKAGYDECKKTPLDSEPAECKKPDASCMATVAELEKCMEDSAKAFQDLVAELPTCSEVTLSSMGSEMVESMDPPSCVAVREKCPGLETPSTSMP